MAQQDIQAKHKRVAKRIAKHLFTAFDVTADHLELRTGKPAVGKYHGGWCQEAVVSYLYQALKKSYSSTTAS